jgi:hypothetical protein
MKFLTVLLFTTVFLSSCTPEMVIVSAITEKNDESSSSSSKEKQRTGINSKYYQGDGLSCMVNIIGTMPVQILTSIFSLLGSQTIDFVLSESLTKVIENDLKIYLKKNKYITPDDFYAALTSTTLELLNKEMFFNFSDISTKRLNTKKQTLAYGFLHYMAAGKKNVAYKFAFDDRRTINGTGSKFTNTISFNGPKKKNQAINLSQCGHTRFTDIPIDKSLKTSDQEMHLVCYDKNGKSASLTKNHHGDYNLEFSTKSKSTQVEMDSTRIDMDESNKSYTKISYKDSSPYYKIGFNKKSLKVTEIEPNTWSSDTETVSKFKCRSL